MPFDDLRQWIAALDRAGELKRIQTEVDPILEIAEITDRVSKMHMQKKEGAGALPKPAFGLGGNLERAMMVRKSRQVSERARGAANLPHKRHETPVSGAP